MKIISTTSIFWKLKIIESHNYVNDSLRYDNILDITLSVSSPPISTHLLFVSQNYKHLTINNFLPARLCTISCVAVNAPITSDCRDSSAHWKVVPSKHLRDGTSSESVGSVVKSLVYWPDGCSAAACNGSRFFVTGRRMCGTVKRSFELRIKVYKSAGRSLWQKMIKKKHKSKRCFAEGYLLIGEVFLNC